LNAAFTVAFSAIQTVTPEELLKLMAEVRFPEIQTTALVVIAALGLAFPLIVTEQLEHWA
jgi:hypothetical protein